MTAGRQSVTDNKDWGTPPKYVNAVREFFGGVIHLDPCSNEYSIVNAVVEYSLPDSDGLRRSWNLPTIYVNPPYGSDLERGTRITDWLQRCEEANHLYGSEVLALVPVATNTGHWKKYVFGKATGICFLYDTRLRFLVAGEDAGKGAPMSCAMIYWGPRYDRFFEVFTRFGAVVDVRPLKAATSSWQKSSRRSGAKLAEDARLAQAKTYDFGSGRHEEEGATPADTAEHPLAEQRHKSYPRRNGQMDLLADESTATTAD